MKTHGILGINARNLLYIRAYNQKKAVKLADSKLKTKHFLSTRGIPVPRLYGALRTPQELEKFDFSTLPNSFVVKPNQGAGGEGILPIRDRHEAGYILSNDELMTQAQLEGHIQDILDGRFSISGIADTVFFEQLLVSDERLARFAYKGLPDVRVVVYNLIPVMAMLRLPTRKSKGRANLHQGAIGVGIDIAKGEATHIVQGTRVLEEVPDAGPIRGLKIPYWDDILHITSKVQMETNLGYLAVDIAIDQATGPVLLEINARAGLGLQIANLAPLRTRLERIKGIKVTTAEKGVRVAKDMFGNIVEKEIKHMTGKKIVGIYETLKILVGSKPYRVKAHLNANIEKSQLDEAFAKKIGLLENAATRDVKLKFILAEQRVQTIASLVNLETKDYSFVIGRRDLGGFLVDPSRKSLEGGIEALPKSVPKEKEQSPSVKVSHNFRVLDEAILTLDQRIKLLYHLKPINLQTERERFLAKEVENPQFIYAALQFDPYLIREKLDRLKLDDSILGRLFQRKRQEILRKIDLLEHRGTPYFFDKSVILFGAVSDRLLEYARERLAVKPERFSPEPLTISTEQAVKAFEQFFKTHSLSNWRVKIKKAMVADCVAGKRNTFFIREGVKFSESRLRMVIAHEIETHIFTAENGKRQLYKIFQRGTGGYLATQEGLAIYNQELASPELTPKHFWNAALVVALHKAQTASFREVFDLLIAMGYSNEKAFQFVLKAKRGLEDTAQPGAFTKDALYFRGHQMVKEFVEQGGDLKRLYIGKIDLPSLEEISELPFLVKPHYLPESLL